MNNYIEVVFEDLNEEVKDILIAQLSEINFDGFDESQYNLKAFISADKFDQQSLNEISNKHKLKPSVSKIEPQNWNSLWESNFDAVIVDDFCEVRAHFHQPSGRTKHEVVITPKMSFGTGHHATTYMMIQQMKDLNFTQMKVADFGTGTGILAILSEKLGSQHIVAIDNDDWSIENAKENIESNNCKAIHLQKSDSFSSPESFDIILANINKNVILSNLSGLVFGLNPTGYLLISGILKEDEKDLINACTTYNLSCRKIVERNNWISMLFQPEGERSVN